MAPSTSVVEYYAGKRIFVTGATGFMGKVLVEKLLRSCPDVEAVFILLREKRGQNSQERLKEFGNSAVFNRLRQEHPEWLAKIKLIGGDILKEGLALSPADKEELESKCQILFHCAACVRFDQKLKDAVNMNTAGTRRVLELAQSMRHLEVFVHVSTSYCHCELEVLEEKVYNVPHKPDCVIRTVNWMDDELLDHMQPKIIAPQPNTYAYTKSLTEDVIAAHAGKFPIAIARPSIVTAAWKEPMPGWVENLNGPTGLLVGAGKGVIRTMHCEQSYRADVVPVDMVVNGCILMAYKMALEKPLDVQVYNITQSEVNPLTWGRAIDLGRYHVQEFPFSVCLWYPGGSIKSSWIFHQMAHLFTHLLPAYFIDLLLILLGKKPFMVKVQKRVSNGLEVLQYYTTKEWYFKNDNFLALQKFVSPEENKIFYTDINEVDWSLYIRNYILGAREYCCKDDPSTLPQARRLHNQLYYIDKAVQFFFYFIISWLVYSYVHFLSWIFSAAGSAVSVVLPVARVVATEQPE